MFKPMPFNPLLAVGVSLTRDVQPTIPINTMNYLENILLAFINGKMQLNEAKQIFLKTIGNAAPVNRVAQVLEVPPEPLATGNPNDINSAQLNKKSRPWNELEDIRLLAGIHRYGLECWGSISRFVGNARTKAQCSQRWARGLDPRIAKIHWSEEEDQLLLASVARHGVKCWTLIACEVPSRSDVQCRYRFHQLNNEKKIYNYAVNRKSGPYQHVSLMKPQIPLLQSQMQAKQQIMQQQQAAEYQTIQQQQQQLSQQTQIFIPQAPKITLPPICSFANPEENNVIIS